MNVIDHLATTLKRRDEVPNQELAEKIAKTGDKEAVGELIELLKHKSKDLQHDAIKVLYEIGERKAGLISGHMKVFIDLLSHRNNRLQWGAMTAISSLVAENHREVYKALPGIISAAEQGSVITRDYAVKILIQLCSIKSYTAEVFPLLLEQLLGSPANQLPMYAENAMPVINDGNKAAFIKTLESRLDDIEKESKRNRVEKVIRKLQKI
jgi:hypothetical protein